MPRRFLCWFKYKNVWKKYFIYLLIDCTVSGEVAENTTRACQSSCTTGYAYWTSRVCVDICPTNPSMFAKTSTK